MGVIQRGYLDLPPRFSSVQPGVYPTLNWDITRSTCLSSPRLNRPIFWSLPNCHESTVTGSSNPVLHFKYRGPRRHIRLLTWRTFERSDGIQTPRRRNWERSACQKTIGKFSVVNLKDLWRMLENSSDLDLPAYFYLLYFSKEYSLWNILLRGSSLMELLTSCPGLGRFNLWRFDWPADAPGFSMRLRWLIYIFFGKELFYFWEDSPATLGGGLVFLSLVSWQYYSYLTAVLNSNYTQYFLFSSFCLSV